MDMKKLIESMDHIEECGMSEMPAMSAPAPMDQGNPVTMNVSLNASGKEHVADLLDMMKNAGLQQAEPVSAKMLSPRMDMERLRDVVDGPADGLDDREMQLPAPEMGEEEVDADEGYENEPDEEYGDIEDVIASGDDLHKSKKGYKAAAGGDNPMSFEEEIKSRLMAALSEKKKPDADGDGVPDWADKKPGKDDNAGKKKGSKPKKGEVPPQFKKK
jgi:hypothetical protein